MVRLCISERLPTSLSYWSRKIYKGQKAFAWYSFCKEDSWRWLFTTWNEQSPFTKGRGTNPICHRITKTSWNIKSKRQITDIRDGFVIVVSFKVINLNYDYFRDIYYASYLIIKKYSHNKSSDTHKHT